MRRHRTQHDVPLPMWQVLRASAKFSVRSEKPSSPALSVKWHRRPQAPRSTTGRDCLFSSPRAGVLLPSVLVTVPLLLLLGATVPLCLSVNTSAFSAILYSRLYFVSTSVCSYVSEDSISSFLFPAHPSTFPLICPYTLARTSALPITLLKPTSALTCEGIKCSTQTHVCVPSYFFSSRRACSSL